MPIEALLLEITRGSPGTLTYVGSSPGVTVGYSAIRDLCRLVCLMLGERLRSARRAGKRTSGRHAHAWQDYIEEDEKPHQEEEPQDTSHSSNSGRYDGLGSSVSSSYMGGWRHCNGDYSGRASGRLFASMICSVDSALDRGVSIITVPVPSERDLSCRVWPLEVSSCTALSSISSVVLLLGPDPVFARSTFPRQDCREQGFAPDNRTLAPRRCYRSAPGGQCPLPR